MPGGLSNTSAVHMRDHGFSKHTLIEICPFEGKQSYKQEFCVVLHPILPPKQDFFWGGNKFCGIGSVKMTLAL